MNFICEIGLMDPVRQSLLSALGQHRPGMEFDDYVKKPLCSRQKLSKGSTVEDLIAAICSPFCRDTWFLTTQNGLRFIDSSACAALLKELGRKGRSSEAFQIFDWLRTLDSSHELYHLLDVFTYTTMIAQCGTQGRLPRAFEFLEEMKRRNVQCNVHTYTALMHVYTKTDRIDLAMGIPQLMKQDGCKPNLVTFNTLINLFRKTGEWKKAVEVIEMLDELHIDAEAKTYNSVISTCSSSGEPGQALYVYRKMLARNVQPSATTYTALISAHGKRGLIKEALDIFNDMVARGCERNVITYSSLMGACEKSGQWQLAFNLLHRMKAEGIQPNIITYNSLLLTCANSNQLSFAHAVYDYMMQDGCQPDLTTFSTLLGVLRGQGHWMTAVQIYNDMLTIGSGRPDNVSINIVLDILWASGHAYAQKLAIQIWRIEQSKGVLKLSLNEPVEYSVDIFTSGAAIITVMIWLSSLRGLQTTKKDVRLLMKCDRRCSLEHHPFTIYDSVAGFLKSFRVPFDVALSDNIICLSPIPGSNDLEEWIIGDDCAGMIRTIEEAMSVPHPTDSAAVLNQFKFKTDQCTKAYQSVLDLEISWENVPSDLVEELTKNRASIVDSALHYACGFGFREETALDAVYLFDRLVASGHLSIQTVKNRLQILLAVCVLTTAEYSEKDLPINVPDSFGFLAEDLFALKISIKDVMKNDVRGFSPLRIVNLFRELLHEQSIDNDVFLRVITRIAKSALSLEFSSSLVACCVFYAMRRELNLYPYWPTQLSSLTGYHFYSLEEIVKRSPEIIYILKDIFIHDQGIKITKPQG